MRTLRVGRVETREEIVQEARLLRQLGKIAQRDGRPADARCRHQQRHGIEDRQPVAVPGPQAPRKVNADAGVNPHHQRQAELARHAPPCSRDQRAQYPGVTALDSEIVVRHARAHDMDDAQRDDRTAKDELRPFPGREPQRATAEQRPQREKEMQQQRAVEDGLTRQALPDEDEPDAAHLNHAERDQSQRMIEQMGGDVEK